jgi:hypothetical protein
VPHLIWQDLDHCTSSPYQQPVLPNINGQAAFQPYCVCRPNAIWANDGLLYRQELPLPRPNDPLALVAVLRLLGDEGGLVLGAELGH